MKTPLRRSFQFALVLSAPILLATCTGDSGPVSPDRYAVVAFQPVLPAQSSLAAFGLSINTIRIRLARAAQDVVVDTTVVFPPDADEVQVVLEVPLSAESNVFELLLELRDNTVVLFSALQQVTLSQGPNETPDVPVTYQGPGGNVATLTITPRDTVITQGDQLQLEVAAEDASGLPVTDFFVIWRTSDETVAKVNGAAQITAPTVRDTLIVTAETPGGIMDETTLGFAPAPSSVDVTSTVTTGTAGTTIPFTVQVLGADGLGVPSVQVDFAAVTTGTVADASLVTDGQGNAATTIDLAGDAGPHEFTATVSGGGPSGTLQVAVEPDVPAQLALVAGDGQGAPAGAALQDPLVVLVTDQFDNPVAGVEVDWAVTSGGGSVSPILSTSDAQGLAQTTWTLGPTQGAQTAEASVVALNQAPVQFTATADPPGVRWINASGGVWSEPTNWNTGQVPAAGDSVVIELDGTYNVLVDVSTSVAFLVLGAEIGTQTMTVPFQVSLSVDGGITVRTNGAVVQGPSFVRTPAVTNEGTWTVTSNGDLRSLTTNPILFENLGTFLHQNGTTTLRGNVINRAGATVVIEGPSTTSSSILDVTTVQGTFTNEGTLSFTGANTRLDASGNQLALTNTVSGIVTTAGTGTHTIDAAITNDGTMTIGAPTILGGTGGVQHFNNGTLDVSGGDFTVLMSGTAPVSNFFTDGSITIAAGRTMLVQTFGVLPDQGNFTYRAGTIGGAGSLRFEGGVVAFGIPFVNGTLDVFVDRSTLGGTITNTGTWTLAGVDVIGDFDNQGQLTIGAVVVGGASTRMEGAFFNRQGASTTIDASGTPTALVAVGGFTNEGAVALAGDEGASLQTEGGVLVNAPTGSLTNSGAITQIVDASMDNQGLWVVGGDLELRYSLGDAAHLNSGTLSVAAGDLTVQQAGTTPSFANQGLLDIGAARTMVLVGSASGQFVNGANGTLQGQGTFDVGPGGFTSDGAIGPGSSPGILTINGDATLTANGSLNIELGGTTVGTEYDRFVVTGQGTVDGSLNVSLLAGFVPVVGDSFTVGLIATPVGEFSAINGLDVGDGVVLEPVFLPTELALVARTATAAWINPAGGNWSDGANWSSGTAPGPTENVVISLDGSYTVVLDVDAAVGSLVVGGGVGTQTLFASGRSLTLNGPGVVESTGELVYAGGSILNFNEVLTNRGLMTLNGPRVEPQLANEADLTLQGATLIRQLVTVPTSAVTVETITGTAAAVQLQSSLLNSGTLTLTSSSTGAEQVQLILPDVANQSTGTIAVPPGPGNRVISGGFFNGGAVVIEAPLSVFDAQITNGNSGVIDILTGGSLLLSVSDFRQQGTVNLTGGDWTVTGTGLFPNFENSGVIDVPSGRTVTISGLNYGHSLGGDVTGQGSISIANGGLNVADPLTMGTVSWLLADLTIGGTSTMTNAPGAGLTIVGGTVGPDLDNQDVLRIEQTVTFTGALTNAATGIVEGTGTLDVTGGSFVSDGATNPGTSPGILTVNGDATLTATSDLNIELGGLVVGTEYDRLVVTGTGAVSGNLNVTVLPGFTPVVGDSFTVGQIGTPSGDFSAINGLDIGGGLVLEPVFLPTELALVVRAVTGVQWTGALSTDWNTPGNWTPSQVPSGVEDVLIPAAPANQPVLTSDASVNDLTIDIGAVLDNGGFTLTVNGSASAGGLISDGQAIIGAGTTVMAGAGVTLAGTYSNVTIDGTTTALASSWITGDLLVLGGAGSLTLSGGGAGVLVDGSVTAQFSEIVLNGTELIVTGNLSTVGTGAAVIMNQPLDMLTVNGDASFGGSTPAGGLSAGDIFIGGNFSQVSAINSFVATGSHTVNFVGPGVAQTVSMVSPGTSSLGNVVVSNAAGLDVTNTVVASGTFTSIGGVPLIGLGALTVGGDITTDGDVSITVLGVGGVLTVSGVYSVVETRFNGVGQTIPVSLPYQFLTVTGSGATYAGGTTLGGDLMVEGPGASLAVTGDIDVASDLIVNGDGASLVLGGITNISGQLGVQSLGGPVSVTLGGLTTVGLDVTTSFGAVILNGSQLNVTGNLFTSGTGGTIVMDQPTDLLIVGGDATFGGSTQPNGLSAGEIQVGGDFIQNAALGAFDASGTHRVVLNGLGPQTVSFVSPGTPDGFQQLEIDQSSTVTLATNVVARGSLIVPAIETPTVTGSNTLLTVSGLAVDDITFDNVRLASTDGTITQFDNVTFQNMDGAATQLTVTHPGAATPFTFNNTVFSPITTGLYIAATDTDAVAPFLTIDMAGSTPADGAPGELEAGGAVVNWPDALPPGIDNQWLGTTSSSWGVGANWSAGTVPTASENVFIQASTPFAPDINSTAAVADLVLDAGAVLGVSDGFLTVNGNLDAANGTINSFGTLILAGASATAAAAGLPSTQVTGAITATTSFTVNGDLSISGASGDLFLNANQIDVTGNFSVVSGARVTMQNAADRLVVNGDVLFDGQSTSTRLTNGQLTVGGNFTQSATTSTNSFTATGLHVTLLNGTAAQTISMASPAGGLSSFANLQIDNTASVSMPTTVHVGGNMQISQPVAVTGADSLRVFGVSGLSSVAGSSISVPVLQLRGPLGAQPAGYAVDTTIFSGVAVQTINPALPYQDVFVEAAGAGANVQLGGPTTFTGDFRVTGSGSDLTVNGQSLTIGGNLTLTSNGQLIMQNANDLVVVQGNATFQSAPTAGNLSAGTLELRGDLTQLDVGAVTTNFLPTGSHRTVFSGTGPQSISFQSPTASGFAELDVRNAVGVTLLTAATASDALVVPNTVAAIINGGGNTLTVTGLDVDGLTLDNTPLVSVDGNLTLFDNVTFQGMDPVATQFTISHPGAGTPVTFTNTSFLVPPTLDVGFYIDATDNLADGNQLTVNLIASFPFDGSASTLTAGADGGAIVDWTGVSPVLSNPLMTLTGLNACDPGDGGPLGSAFDLSFDYVDPDGDVTELDALVTITFTFNPTGNTGTINPTTTTFTGTPFNGSITVPECIRFDTDTSVDQDITLTDAVGNVSEVISISTLQPGGANAPPAEGAAPPPTPSEGGSVVASRGS